MKRSPSGGAKGRVSTRRGSGRATGVRGGSSVRILDRQRYWAFLKAYVICYMSLVGLYIVIDAFSNLDEFAKRAEGVVETLLVMGRYYLIHQSIVFRPVVRRDRDDGSHLHRDLDAAK